MFESCLEESLASCHEREGKLDLRLLFMTFCPNWTEHSWKSLSDLLWVPSGVCSIWILAAVCSTPRNYCGPDSCYGSWHLHSMLCSQFPYNTPNPLSPHICSIQPFSRLENWGPQEQRNLVGSQHQLEPGFKSDLSAPLCSTGWGYAYWSRYVDDGPAPPGGQAIQNSDRSE